MGWSKRKLVEKAYEKIGLASYVFDLAPEQLQSGMSEMDAMIAAWGIVGIRLGYPIPSSPTKGNLADDSGLSDRYSKAVYENLAILLASNIGRQVSAQLIRSAAYGYSTLLARFSQPPTRRIPGNVPAGGGSKSWDRPFIDEESDSIAAGDDSELEFK